MKAYLMHPGTDFDTSDEFPPGTDALIDDLELTTLLRTMAAGDDYLFGVARTALVRGLTDPAGIVYRQRILADCLAHPTVIRDIYGLAVQAITEEKRIWWGAGSRYPSAILHRAVDVMNIFTGALRKLRALAESASAEFSSAGFTRFFAMIRTELDDDYFTLVAGHLKRLKFRDGIVISAGLGPGNAGTGYVLRTPRPGRRGIAGLVGAGNQSGYTFTVSDRDEAGARALSALSDQGINHVASALAQSADHVLGFFRQLRAELAFYVGCLNAHERLAGQGGPVCFPVPLPPDDGAFAAAGLYDPCLALTVPAPVVGNDVSADGKTLVMVTGANQGGKSTFLRSTGLALLMMRSGMFAAAASLRASACGGLFTHFKRAEDAGLTSGKLDEELARMSAITQHVTPGSVLLCNESFAATNEREGSQIARQVIQALRESGIRVFFVTHLYDLAHGCYRHGDQASLFLRAERRPDGSRTFRVTEGEPLPTSHGKDVYHAVFGAAAADG